MQCIYSYAVFILYLLDKFIYFVAIHAEIIQMYLFSLQWKFYCIYTLNGYFIHVFTYIIFTQVCTVPRCTELTFILFTNKIYCPKACYVMLWPALTWRGQEWAQHVQGQLLHTCIMQIAGSSHVMELLTDSI